MGTARFPRV